MTLPPHGIEWATPADCGFTPADCRQYLPRTVLFGCVPGLVMYAIDRARLGDGYVVFYNPALPDGTFSGAPNRPIWTPTVATVEEAQALALGHAAALAEAATLVG